MFSGPPLPLPPTFPLWQLPPLLHYESAAGAWFRGAHRNVRARLWSGSSRSELLVAGDLGFLIRHCTSVVVLEGHQAVLLRSELLIQWRALQVVTGIPFQPCPHRLKELFPDAEVTSAGFQVPTRWCAPESVLADCLAYRIPVTHTNIVYRNPAASG